MSEQFNNEEDMDEIDLNEVDFQEVEEANAEVEELTEEEGEATSGGAFFGTGNYYGDVIISYGGKWYRNHRDWVNSMKTDACYSKANFYVDLHKSGGVGKSKGAKVGYAKVTGGLGSIKIELYDNSNRKIGQQIVR